MKIPMLLISLILTLVTYAQDFKPYRIESGKITYEKLKYATVSSYSSQNGVETHSTKQLSYVSEEVSYYWDQFGDIAFEETYQISKLGGERLPEKVKIAERLWIDEHRYYFNFKENKVYDEPYYLRIKCRTQFQYYQIVESWLETLYMGAEKLGTQSILGLEADYYKIDEFQDLYVWNGLVLKNEDFSTTTEGERLHLNRLKLATAIDTFSIVKEDVFNPIWLKRENLYRSLDEEKIVEIFDCRPDVTEQVDYGASIKLKKNDILLFVTRTLAIGKMQVLDIDTNNNLVIKYALYKNYNLINEDVAFNIKNNTSVNIDDVDEKEVSPLDIDFKLEDSEITSPNNIGIYLLKASRTKTLKIKAYQRKW